jgi:hypothetical protein
VKKLLLIAAIGGAVSWATYHYLSASGAEKTAVNPAVQLQQGKIAEDAAQRAADAAKESAKKMGQAAEDAGK